MLSEGTMYVTCPSCHQQLNVPDQLAGQQVRCPLCQTILQAPAAGMPAAPPAPAPAPPPPPDRRYGSDLDEPGVPDQYETGRGSVQHLLNRGAIHLTIGAALFALMGVANLILDIVLTSMAEFRPDFFGAYLVVRVFMALLFIGTPVVFMFIGAVFLRRARGRGLVLTGAILAIVLASLCIFALLGQVIAMGSTRWVYGSRQGAALLMMSLAALLLLGAIVYGFLAGCMTLSLLGRPEVKQAYGVYVPRRRRRRYEYDRPEYDRYGDDW
jgi:uncharacterized membrane protein YhaH (DUF805 family)